MTHLSYDHLASACRAGGASVITSITHLSPAAGTHAGVAPGRYVSGRNATYAFETRFIAEQAMRTVLLDSKASTCNRMEETIKTAILDGDPLLSRTPRIEVTYEGHTPVADYELPHRFSDAHIRMGSVEGSPVTQHPDYRAARDATPLNARPLLELSPISLVFGAWDSTRKNNQGRYRTAMSGETIGVLAEQGPDEPEMPLRGAARVDSLAPSVQLSEKDFETLLASQEEELSPKTVEKFREEIKKAKGRPISGSGLGLGAIPPSLSGLGLVACREIIRSHVLSFATLRQLRFGAGAEGDAACRTLLAALALNLMARSQSELNFRANCDLKEAGVPSLVLDQRYGQELTLETLTVDVADELLATAIDKAVAEAGIRWEGQVFSVIGNPIVLGSAVAEPEE